MDASKCYWAECGNQVEAGQIECASCADESAAAVGSGGRIAVEIVEAGNGWVDVGDHVVIDGSPYRVVSVERSIQTDGPPGSGNYVRGEVVESDWSLVGDADCYSARVAEEIR